MKKSTKLFTAGILSLSMFLTGSNVLAGGVKDQEIISLGDSGLGGTTYASTIVDENALYYESCGSISYKKSHEISFGTFNTSSFHFNSTSFTISNLSGGDIQGGVGYTGNYQDETYNEFDYKYYGAKLSANQKYTYNWNRTIPLGSNTNAHYDMTTASGYPSPAIICNNEVNFIFDVGGRSSFALLSSIEDDFTQNKNKLTQALENKYKDKVKVKDKIVSKGALLSEYRSIDTLMALTQQKGASIKFNEIKEEDYTSYSNKGFKYELAELYNVDGVKLNIIKFKQKGIYLALVTSLPKEEAIELLRELN